MTILPTLVPHFLEEVAAPPPLLIMTLICSVVLPWQPLLVLLPRLTYLQDSPQPLHPPPPPTLTCSLVCRQPLLQSHLASVHLVQQLLQALVLLPWIFLMALVCPPSHHLP